MKRRLLTISFSLILLLGVSHQLGSMFYLYWDSFWFDFYMHILGGMAVGFFFLWAWYASGLFGEGLPSRKESMVSVFVFVMLVGIGWEFFEFVYGIANPVGGNYPLDTFHDVVADMLGGGIVGFLGRYKWLYE